MGASPDHCSPGRAARFRGGRTAAPPGAAAREVQTSAGCVILRAPGKRPAGGQDQHRGAGRHPCHDRVLETATSDSGIDGPASTEVEAVGSSSYRGGAVPVCSSPGARRSVVLPRTVQQPWRATRRRGSSGPRSRARPLVSTGVGGYVLPRSFRRGA